MELLLEEALQSLKPEEQAGIVARFFEGKDFQEMAQMFSITEPAARKRTSRCLAKLQAFMAKRGVKVALPSVLGLLTTRTADAASKEALGTAIHAAHAIWKGNVAAGNAVALADRAVRLLRWRFLGVLSLRVGLPLMLLLAGLWYVREWNRPVPERIAKLGKAWGALDQRVAQHRQFLMQTPPSAPNYQAKVQEELGAISRESSRIKGELSPLLAPPDARARFAQFLIAELDDTLNLAPSEKTALFSYIQNRLAQGASP